MLSVRKQLDELPGPTVKQQREKGRSRATLTDGCSQSIFLRELFFIRRRRCVSNEFLTCLSIYTNIRIHILCLYVLFAHSFSHTALGPFPDNLIQLLGLDDHARDVLSVTPGQPFRLNIHVLVSCLFYGASSCFALAPRRTFAFYLGRLFEKNRNNKELQTLHSRLSTFQPVPWFLL